MKEGKAVATRGRETQAAIEQIGLAMEECLLIYERVRFVGESYSIWKSGHPG